jgi:hypothetical protein
MLYEYLNSESLENFETGLTNKRISALYLHMIYYTNKYQNGEN